MAHNLVEKIFIVNSYHPTTYLYIIHSRPRAYYCMTVLELNCLRPFRRKSSASCTVARYKVVEFDVISVIAMELRTIHWWKIDDSKALNHPNKAVVRSKSIRVSTRRSIGARGIKTKYKITDHSQVRLHASSSSIR